MVELYVVREHHGSGSEWMMVVKPTAVHDDVGVDCRACRRRELCLRYFGRGDVGAVGNEIV